MIKLNELSGSDFAARALRAVRRIAPAAAYVALISRVNALGGANPFAHALCAALLAAGVNPLGPIMGMAFAWNADALGGLATACVWAVCDWGFKRAGRGRKEIACACAAFGGALCAGCLRLNGDVYGVLAAVMSSAIAALLAPVLYGARAVSALRTRLLPDERVSLAAHMMFLLLGMRASLPAPFALAAASLCALLAGGVNAGLGACAALSAGAALTLAGESAGLSAALGACALCESAAGALTAGRAGGVKWWPRIARALAFAAGGGIAAALGGFDSDGARWVALLAPCAAYCALPTAFVEFVERLFSPRARVLGASELALALRAGSGRRAGRLAEGLQALADGYRAPESLPERRRLLDELRSGLCGGCKGYEACWSGDGRRAGMLLVRLMGEALSGRKLTPFSQLPPDDSCACRRSSSLDRVALPIVEAFSERRRGDKLRDAFRQLTSGQLRRAARLLSGLAAEMSAPMKLDERAARLAEAALDREGMPDCDAVAVRGRELELIVSRNGAPWNPRAARRAARALSDELGERFEARLDGDCLRFAPAPNLAVSAAAAARPARAGDECGDAHAAFRLPGGDYALALSDGMGRGSPAAEKSREALKLTRSLLEAGIEPDEALPAVNALMQADGCEAYATLDMCVLELNNGEASFYKLGGCASLVLSRGEARRIEGGQLPLGVLDEAKAQCARAPIAPGDVIVIATDGVCDALSGGAFEECALENAALSPARLASAIIERAAKADAGDDMTVLAARIASNV